MPPTRSAHIQHKPSKSSARIHFVYVLFMLLFGVFVVRLFYLQVIRYDYYATRADKGHIKQRTIAANRGIIKVHSGDTTVPLVLNEQLYTVYADPSLVTQVDQVASALSEMFGGETGDYKEKIGRKNTRYVVIERRVDKTKKDQLLDKKFKGIGAQAQEYRTYPNGTLAAQLLGFVNNEGKGVYGIEQALNDVLAGKDGELKAVTDVNGVPLAANKDNILIQPESGKDVLLTVDMGMQKQLEDILKMGAERARSEQVSAVIMEANTGAIKAMANYPTYSPADSAKVTDAALFTNPVVSHPIEVGSIMKPLTMAAALDKGAVNAGTTYYDPAKYKVDNYTITNIEEDGGPGTKTMADLLNLSLNTGATWLLMQMGGSGDQITEQGRKVWYDYMSNHYMFGKKTGIEQGYEATGMLPDPVEGYARNLTFANTSFGQAMTATPLQMAAAYATALNGGTYYKPTLVDSYIDPQGNVDKKQPQVVAKNLISAQASKDLMPMMEYTVKMHSFERKFDQDSYAVGGKTGTAQIARPEGGYYEDQFNGTYVGFVGGDSVQYVIAVMVVKPQIPGYAGSRAAQPVFGDLAHMLIDKFNVTPKGR